MIKRNRKKKKKKRGGVILVSKLGFFFVSECNFQYVNLTKTKFGKNEIWRMQFPMAVTLTSFHSYYFGMFSGLAGLYLLMSFGKNEI